MKHILVLFLLSSLNLFAQELVKYNGEKINLLDKDNQKQGLWKLFDEENDLMITCEMEDDTLSSDINYYKNAKLIISYKKKHSYYLLRKGLDTIHAKLIKTPDKRTSIVKMNGENLDTAISNWFYKNAEINSMFYGGQAEFSKFMSKTINVKNTENHEGKVKVKFVIDANGFPKDVEVVDGSIDEKLINEAIRLVKAMPRWQPAHQRGMFVATSYAIPISFK